MERSQSSDLSRSAQLPGLRGGLIKGRSAKHGGLSPLLKTGEFLFNIDDVMFLLLYVTGSIHNKYIWKQQLIFITTIIYSDLLYIV